MQFFHRILTEPAPAARGPARDERRNLQRLAVHPDFPLKASLSFTDGDNTRLHREWKGRLLNCSAVGARIQLGAAALEVRGDFGDLKLNLEGYKLVVPTRIANMRVESNGVIFGLTHEFDNAATQGAYRQLLGILALGATLKLKSKSAKPDESGYLVESYAGDWSSGLRVWRDPADLKVAAFEFLLRDSIVRGARGRSLQYLDGTDAAVARQAADVKAPEMNRLFHWVTFNLPPAVPADVREFLQSFGD